MTNYPVKNANPVSGGDAANTIQISAVIHPIVINP